MVHSILYRIVVGCYKGVSRKRLANGAIFSFSMQDHFLYTIDMDWNNKAWITTNEQTTFQWIHLDYVNKINMTHLRRRPFNYSIGLVHCSFIYLYFYYLYCSLSTHCLDGIGCNLFWCGYLYKMKLQKNKNVIFHIGRYTSIFLCQKKAANNSMPYRFIFAIFLSFMTDSTVWCWNKV